MFTHIVLGADDITAAKKFYDAVLTALGHAECKLSADGKSFTNLSENGVLTITNPIDGNSASFGNGSTIGLLAKTEKQVDKAYQAATANGGQLISEPKKVTTPFGFDIRVCYFRDITGNKLCVSYIYAAQ